jgi:hypothetical protein
MPAQAWKASAPERHWLRRAVSRAAVYGESGYGEEVKPIHLRQPTLRILSTRPDISGHSRDRRVTNDTETPSAGQEPWSSVATGEAEHRPKFIKTKCLSGVARLPDSGMLVAGQAPV